MTGRKKDCHPVMLLYGISSRLSRPLSSSRVFDQEPGRNAPEEPGETALEKMWSPRFSMATAKRFVSCFLGIMVK